MTRPSVLFEDSGTFDDGTRYEMIAASVPRSEEHPEGVKHRFQYMDEDGRTLLRFDDFPEHPAVDRHHCHTPDGVFASTAREGTSNYVRRSPDVEYAGLVAHVGRFYRAVDARRER